MKYKVRIAKRTTCWRPTWLGWLLFLILAGILFRLFLIYSVRFLSQNHPVHAKTLVVEGWVETYVVLDALQYYRENGYERMVVTGIPITIYEFIAPYKNTAEATIVAMQYFGFNDTIYRANIPTNVYVDRTYHTGLMVKNLFDDHSDWEKSIDVYSVGVHSRRSRFLFQEALGPDFKVGIISHPDRTFQAESWWRSSKGFRNVTNELIATPYAMLFFNPNREASEKLLYQGRLIDEIVNLRDDKNNEIADSTVSPFNREERAAFHGLNYFEPDLTYRIRARMVVDTSAPPFPFATNTARRPTFRVYGKAEFSMHDTACVLTVFQNMDALHDPEYGNLLFLPFQDKTNGVSTYDAGRYLDISIPDSMYFWIDFNRAYNPYCAYSSRWSCPLAPFENQMNVAIRAGEKKYNH